MTSFNWHILFLCVCVGGGGWGMEWVSILAEDGFS